MPVDSVHLHDIHAEYSNVTQKFEKPKQHHEIPNLQFPSRKIRITPSGGQELTPDYAHNLYNTV